MNKENKLIKNIIEWSLYVIVIIGVFFIPKQYTKIITKILFIVFIIVIVIVVSIAIYVNIKESKVIKRAFEEWIY
jgi:hypothetical protein